MVSKASPYDKVIEDAERRQITVFLCDLVGSTQLSEEVDPEELRDLIIAFRQTCNRPINKYKGFVARYAGDSVLAYFGYPYADENEAENAVSAGLEIVDELNKMPGRKLNVRIGIATGTVIAGDLVADGTQELHGIVGKTPNLADRLMKLANPGEIVICDETQRLVEYFFKFEKQGPMKLKGIAEAQTTWKILGESSLKSRSEIVHLVDDLTPMIGREPEISHLLQCFNEAYSGHGRAVLLSGEPGIGKSRLVRHVIENIQTVSSGRAAIRSIFCSHIHQNVPLYPILKLIESEISKSNSGKNRSSKDRVSACVDIVEYFNESPKPHDSNSLERKAELFDKIESYFIDVMKDGFLVLIFEDMHWCDSLTFELLDGFLSNWLNRQDVLIICTYRPNSHWDWPESQFITKLNLNRLGPKESRNFLFKLSNNADLSLDIFEEILAKGEGIPLVLEELLKHVLEFGGDYSNVSNGQNEFGEFIPNSLAASLTARLDELGPAKKIAQAASIVGQTFSIETLHALTSFDETALTEALDKLVESGIIYQQSEEAGANFVFKHALVHDAAYLSVLHRERRELHAKIVGIFNKSQSENGKVEPALLADHCSKGGMSEEAIGYWLEAGRRAFEQSAYADAVGHLTKGLGEFNETIQNERIANLEVGIRVLLARTLHALHGGAAEDVGFNYFRARELIRDSANVKKKLEVLVGCWIHSFISAKFADAISLGEEILELAKISHEQKYLAEANRINGMTSLYSGEFEAARDYLVTGLDLYSKLDAGEFAKSAGLDPVVCSRSYLAYTRLLLGDKEAAIKDCMATVDYARDLSHNFTTAFSFAFAAFIYQHLDELDATITYSSHSITVAKSNNFKFWERQQSVICNWAIAKQNQTESNLTKLKNAIGEYLEEGRRIEVTRMYCLLSEIYALNNDLDFAYKFVKMARQAELDSGERLYAPEILRLTGIIKYKQDGNLADLKGQLGESLEIARKQRSNFWADRTEEAIEFYR